MNCLKCGKETKGTQVFCDRCLQVMESYPVRSDTPIHLPNRTEAQPPKKQAPRKKVIPPEEQIQQLKTANRRLVLIVISLILALGLCVGGFAYHLMNQSEQPTPRSGSVGRNYTYAPD